MVELLWELLPSSSPWHKQAGCPCSSYGRKNYSLERKGEVNTTWWQRDEGVCVERWGLENLTGLLSWPGNSTSPLMKARLEQSMWCNRRVILLVKEGRGKKRERQAEERHTHTHINTELHGKIFKLCKHSQITMEQGSSSKTAKIRSALWCDPRESIKDLNSPVLHFKVQLYDSVRFSLQELKHVMFIVHRHTKEKHSPCLFRKCQQDELWEIQQVSTIFTGLCFQQGEVF